LVRRLTYATLAALLLVGTAAGEARAEDGYDLWLRYRPVEGAALKTYRSAAAELVIAGAESPTLLVVRQELTRGLERLLGADLRTSERVTRDGAIVFGTPASSPVIAGLGLDLRALGPEGFLIRSLSVGNRRTIAIAGTRDVGVLYGAFHLLRLIQTGAQLQNLDITSAPRVQVRVLNHWDNLDRHVERGYAGQSIWDWHKLPGYVDPRYTDYARANAAIGINGTVLTNVNANAMVLRHDYLEKAAAIAAALRPYGIRVHLTARFSAPIELGGLKTADPLDPRVRAWWQAKIDEIYTLIPDFGGFLVKANSEGQPGPQDYQRTHADGANMFADALSKHGGIVMWRAFVYSSDPRADRVKEGYREFVPLDGLFRDNVIVQVKNGAIDFQPREPFHPLFGALPKTPTMMEFQITKEYLGFATHLAYLGTMWEEALDADTHVRGSGSTVARVVDGSLFSYRRTGMAGVSNIGTDRNWTGSHFDQANWYAFGRLAWDQGLSAEAIAREWTRLTFAQDEAVVAPIVRMMMGSREAVVNYMMPLGLQHLFATGHHYGPGPWVDNLTRPEWNPFYYHRADARQVGFDRSSRGSNAVEQYAAPLRDRFERVETTPQEFLLYFHRLPWDHRLPSGRSLWDELVMHYSRGVEQVAEMRRTWAALDGRIDAERYAQIAGFLAIQEREAQWWRDACLAYFQSINGLPYPKGYAAPPHPVDYYKGLSYPYAPGRG